jgi:hypothetical protein
MKPITDEDRASEKLIADYQIFFAPESLEEKFIVVH